MRKKTSFRPSVSEELESRVVMSTISAPSAVVQGLLPRMRVPGRVVQQPIVTLVNSSFDSFVSDYSQARGAYLSALTAEEPNAQTNATTAFTSYTRYRVDLLAQEVTSSFLQGIAGQSRHAKANPGPVLGALIRRQINAFEIQPSTTNGITELTGKVYRVGTLGRALIDTIPPAGSSPAAASLSFLAQDQAIESARVSIINGFNLARVASMKRS